MTSQTKDEFLAHAILSNKENGTVVWESSMLFSKFSISASDMEHLLDEFEAKGFIEGLQVGHTFESSLFTFSTTYEADQFLKDGGYQQQELDIKKNKQLQADVNQAAIRSADASEASALASVKSAKEARISRHISLAALTLSIIALVLQCKK